MISNILELQSLIEWCKLNKVKHLKINDIEFQLSELAFLPDDPTEAINSNLNPYNTETLADTDKSPDINSDPDLFWSSST
jgi:hypothetical protein